MNTGTLEVNSFGRQKSLKMVNTRRKNKTHGTQSTDNLISLPNLARDSTNFKELANVKSILALTHTGGYRLWKKSFELHFKRHKVVRFIKQDLTGGAG